MTTSDTRPRWTVAVSGSRGLIGSALVRSLEAGGHRVLRLVRSRSQAGNGKVFWSPATGEIDAAGLEGVDAVVNLAGESVAQPWTEGARRRIRESRVRGTCLLAETLAGLERAPGVFVCASAVGYYGDRGSERLDENAPPGEGFFPETGRAWEAAADPAREAGIRTVHLRFGVVLSREGGMLGTVLPLFRLGAGGKLGSGEQWMSWVSREDAVDAIRFAIGTEGIRGPVNVVAPAPVTNAELTETLGRVLGRPTFLSVPAVLLRLIPGGMGEEALLASQRVVPDRLLGAGFRFQHPDLEGALRAAVGK